MKKNSYVIEKGFPEVVFHNHADDCIGTGRMGLALQKEYLEQLELTQKEIGFSHIRGHGLFCEDMAIYQKYLTEDGETREEYNFTYLDMVMDNYRKLNLKPFLELGFMPKGLASGEQSVFYWKGNVTPPADYHAWKLLVQETLRHLIFRYGAEEVVTWPVEVWNEPNLQIFWKDADMEEYFRLFQVSFEAVKEVDARFRVGGPAICGVEDEIWMRKFLEFCEREKIALDFATRHHYTVSKSQTDGHYSYFCLNDLDKSMEELLKSRAIIDSFPRFRGMELHITEFNTSYRPDSPLHDTNQNAAYIACLLSKLGDEHASYSYWTFGDIFEEQGVPFSPFHGGFGLVANGKIPKPTFWAFQFYKQLKGRCIHRSSDAVLVERQDGKICGIAWNCRKEPVELLFSLLLETEAEYSLITKTVDEFCCNPLKIWHDLGEPKSLTEEQRLLLVQSARPLVASDRLQAMDNGIRLKLTLNRHGILYFELCRSAIKSDRGYSYQRTMEGEGTL